jgi:O-antigen biosynthesis protein WbqV
MNEILFAHEEPTAEVGIEGIVAARPNEPPFDTLQTWLIALEKAVSGEQRNVIVAVLKDAIPEFKAGAA